MLTPRSGLIGKTLKETHFREKYGLSVLAIWRGSDEIVRDLGELPLGFGDALLLQGSRRKLSVLSDDSDLIVMMSKEEAEITVPNKGRVALLIFAATLVTAAFLPDLTGAIMLGGSLAMMLTGILTTEEAYTSIGWKTVFLVAGMLPMGVALSKTNAAGLIAAEIVGLLGGYGGMILLAGLFLTTVLLTQAVNGAVAAAILGPVAIRLAQQSNINPRSMVMGVALASSMAFITPLEPSGKRSGDEPGRIYVSRLPKGRAAADPAAICRRDDRPAVVLAVVSVETRLDFSSLAAMVLAWSHKALGVKLLLTQKLGQRMDLLLRILKGRNYGLRS